MGRANPDNRGALDVMATPHRFQDPFTTDEIDDRPGANGWLQLR